MAVITLSKFNTVAMASGAVDQLIGPGPSGWYDLTLLNIGTGPVYIKDAATVAAGDPNSFELPPNLAITVVVFATTGVWATPGAAAGSVSALLQPRGQ